MEPTLERGDQLLCDRTRKPRQGAVVVRDSGSFSGRRYHVKRLVAVADDTGGRTAFIPPGHCWLEGDNADASGDSRSYGPVPLTELVAVAVALVRGSRILVL